MNQILQYTKSNYKKYIIQFFISISIAIFAIIMFISKIYQMNKYEKYSKELLKEYKITTLYKENNHSELDPSKALTNQNYSKVISKKIPPYIIGSLKIDKINLNYPILSQSNSDLLKISLCRFAGPMPNRNGNLCIAGHNYVDNRFFSNLHKLELNDVIEIYDINGQKKDYIVYDKYEVIPTDFTCAMQNITNTSVITLLTCNNVNSKRLVIKANEK